MKYIIDTDPGIDDAIAIMLAIKNNLDIIGFTLATGNILHQKAQKNLKVIQDFLNTNIKMYNGTKNNMCDIKTAEYAHGKDGLGYAVFPDNSKRKFEKKSAEDFIIKASKKYKDNLTIICLGPLTNLANAIKKDKNLSKRIKHVIIMGTSYNPESNDLYDEFNIKVDPKSADIVFKEPFYDIKLVTHEIGVKSYIEKDYINNLRDSKDIISRFVSLISEKYMEFSYEHYGIIGLCTPDPTTIASIIDSNIIKFEPCCVNVVNNNNTQNFIIKLTEKSNIKVSTDFDLSAFRKIFKETFK